MSEQVLEDQSHYEISLTAGQAFVAFVLLLLSLAASFAFGLLIGKGQNEVGLSTIKQEAALVTPAVKKAKAPVDVPADDFKPQVTETTAPQPAPEPATVSGGPRSSAATAAVDGGPPQKPAAVATGPAYAQLLSSSDQKAAEALAEKLIGAGFNTAYVERMMTDKGAMIFRVRVKFASDAEAHAAEAKLKGFSKDVWITSK